MWLILKPPNVESSRLPSTAWLSLVQVVEGITSKNSELLKKKFCLNTADLGLKAATSINSSLHFLNLPACFADFRFAIPSNCVSQFLELNQSLSFTLTLAPRLTRWFCIFGEPWLIVQTVPICNCPVLFSGLASSLLLPIF